MKNNLKIWTLALTCTCSLLSACSESKKGSSSKSPTAGDTPSQTTATLALKSSLDKSMGWKDASTADQSLSFVFESSEKPSFSCWLRTKSSASAESYSACGSIVEKEMQLNLKSLAGSAADGTYILNVKANFGSKEVLLGPYEFYLHSSLDGVSKCELGVSSEAIFAKASEFLALNQPEFGSSTSTNNPQITIEFDQSNKQEILSLRRSFTLSSDRKLMLVKRMWASKANNNCENHVRSGVKRSNKGKDLELVDCPSFVFNSAGQGVCLGVSNSQVTYIRAIGNAMKKMDAFGSGKMFSRKTKDQAQALANPDILFMPD